MRRLSVMTSLLLFAALSLPSCGGPGASPWAKTAGSGAPAAALDLVATVSADEVALLQPVYVTLDLFRRSDLEVEFDPEVDGDQFASERKDHPAVPLGDGLWQRTVLTLRPIAAPGELEIPAFVAKAVDGSVDARTEPVRLVVTSVLDGHGEALEAPGAPFPPPPRWPLYLGLGLATLLVLGGLVFFLRRRAGDRTMGDAIAVPPHVTALRALERLREAPRRTPAEVEAFYVDVSDVLRQYLEARFGLRAPESTTEEFLRDLEAGDALAREHQSELQRFLTQCDLVKFARHQPGEADHVAMFEIAESFVETTRADRGRGAAGVTGAVPGERASTEEVPA